MEKKVENKEEEIFEDIMTKNFSKTMKHQTKVSCLKNLR